MEFRPVKGTRDFYPDSMRLRNWICDAWRRVSLRNGFEEYDAPIFEYLDLFTVKSGQEIAEQLFSLTDRAGRRLAIRPEITPSLARMVNARINSLPRPIKWFSIPRLCRAEKPQKGRLREFFQWNVDVIGSDDVLADAECIFVCVDFLREIGLAPRDVKVRIGSRALTMAALAQAGLAEARAEAVLPALDKRAKVSDQEFRELVSAAGLEDAQIDAVVAFQDSQDIPAVRERLAGCQAAQAALAELESVFRALNTMGAGDYCVLDMRIVRGLAYYTGIVYEVFDAKQSLRAVGGGGRYDNLLEMLGGPRLGATGFGMGDVVLEILLAEAGRLPELPGGIEYFLIDAQPELFDKVIELAGQLRRRGLAADFSYARRPIGKQLKEANKRAADNAVIVRPDGVAVKNLATGKQSEMSMAKFLASLGPGSCQASEERP